MMDGLAFKNKQIGFVLLYSPKTARRFSELALESGFKMDSIQVICLSTAVAEALQIPVANIIIAADTCENAMMNALKV